MTTNKPDRYWLLSTIILVVVIVIGSLVIRLRYNPGHSLEISMPPDTNIEGIIYLGGAVTNPGLYPFNKNDSIQVLLQAAGGPTDSANMSGLKLYVTPTGNAGPQKIDINRAETWLLEALPGIGETLAQRIVSYRVENGPFRTTSELLKVPRLGNTTYERIRNLITVAE